MLIRSSLIATLVFAATFTVASTPLPTSAQRALDAYVSAFNSYDCATVLSQASPVFVDLLTKAPEGRQAYCAYLEEIKKDSVTCPPGKVVSSASEGAHRLFFVESLCSAGTPTSYPSLEITGFYVLHSNDAGKSWWVLDQTCQPEKLITKAYPPYKGEPALPETRVYVPPWAAR